MTALNADERGTLQVDEAVRQVDPDWMSRRIRRSVSCTIAAMQSSLLATVALYDVHASRVEIGWRMEMA